jgi:2-polyprenyl-3-methyl-5-hydroxy-6-metoxy-1,4-benzoquinol methylase
MSVENLVRDNSILDINSELEFLHRFDNVPASMACTTQSINKDIIKNQIWDICKTTGLIQLRELLPLDVVYMFPHNDAIGKDWNLHNVNFVNFLKKHDIDSVLEIGAGSCKLAEKFLEHKTGYWVGLEPNHDYEQVNIDNFKLVREWFDESYNLDRGYDAIVHSHILEHIYDPTTFLKNVRSKMSDDTLHIFSLPNFKYSLSNKFTNQLNFEHTVLLTEDIVDTLLIRVGFKIIDKSYNDGLPSVFYACKKSKKNEISFDTDIYKTNKRMFLDFVKFYKKEINYLNNKIEKFNGEIYLFGAHIFSQFLIYNGLHTDKIQNVLDNSEMKQGNRLYGTNFKVLSPKILKDKSAVAVILKVANYKNEIKTDIINNINTNVTFWE